MRSDLEKGRHAEKTNDSKPKRQKKMKSKNHVYEKQMVKMTN